MENEIKKLKEKYLETKPTKFLEEQGASDLWGRIDMPKSKHMFFPRYLVIIMVVLLGFGGFISVTYAANPGSALYEVKKITQQVAKHVPIVSSVVPQEETVIPSVTPTPTITLPTPTSEEEKDEENENSNKQEDDRSEKAQDQKENKQNEDVKGESTIQENKSLENKAENGNENKENKSQEDKKSDHKDEDKKESESENHKED